MIFLLRTHAGKSTLKATPLFHALFIYAWQSPARSGVRPRSYRLVGSCEMYVTPPRTYGDEVEERLAGSMKVCSLRILLDVVYVNALYTLKNNPFQKKM